ncbi:isoleucine--tRNA ligase [archaeon]|nr:isoleucine--tRNA ligase [archaeon]
MQNLPEIEKGILKFWEENNIYKKAKEKSKGKKTFFYLDGPPYTSGEIHIGHAWGKALRDSIMRYKRMGGFNVLDQPGFDMHGLPIEHAVEKKFNIANKKEIASRFSTEEFIQECEKFALQQMHPMIRDFKRLGIWMDWDFPYTTITNSYIEGAWFALKKAYENKLLYKGKKAITWCPRCATALAKHELEYETVNEDSVFVKFKICNAKDSFLIIWTTTPWTLPFNLAVMAHPNYDYIKAKVGNETWILAKALANAVIKGVAGKDFTVLKEFKGRTLKGMRYEHPFLNEIPYHKSIFEENKRAHSVIMSEKYVHLDSGTGLVHCAPGCGGEDFEEGLHYALPAFNETDEHGIFSDAMGKYAGLKAKTDDAGFIKALQEKSLLLASTKIEHEYAHCWRCKNPVIFRATEQWFLAVSRLKKKMLKANEKTAWVPDWAGSKQFKSWLENVQDWCISRQRFWGIPLPIWECGCGNFKVVGTAKELPGRLENLHKPWIDEIKIECSKCNKPMSRIPDVVDVWLDSGAAPWASNSKENNKLRIASLILEGSDQIRGWFNSLICLSMLAFKKNSYKAVYMHGMINDASGRKMSKSLKNIISPYEVIDKYGADCLRYYAIGGTNPGLDLNYNFEDMKTKHRNLFILANLSNLLIDSHKAYNLKPAKNIAKLKLNIEEQYILSKMHSTIKYITSSYNCYRLNEPPILAESLFLELSRTYVQIVREKLSSGTKEERKAAFSIIFEVFLNCLKMFAPVCPMLSEYIYQQLKAEFKLKEESIHFCRWPKHNEHLIKKEIEEEFETAKEIVQKGLAERETAGISLKWPLAKAIITSKKKFSKEIQGIIARQLNVKGIEIKEGGQTKVEFDTNLTAELELEGYTREIVRRIQELRKSNGLKKNDKINLAIVSAYGLSKNADEIKKKVNAKKIGFKEKNYGAKENCKIKDKEFSIMIERAGL